MITSYKKINKNLFFLRELYRLFIIISIIIFAYIVVDIHLKSQKSISFLEEDTKKTLNKFIIKPRVQLEPSKDDFHIIDSEKGVWNINSDETKLYKVKVNSTLGTITSDTLDIKDDSNLLEFRGNPVFVLNLENNKEK